VPDPNAETPSRLDRIERIIEALATSQADLEHEHRRLLRAQVVMVDTVQRLATDTDAHFKAMTEAQRHADERMNALIEILDGLVRRKTPPPPPATP
jgi:hypothetical protein